MKRNVYLILLTIITIICIIAGTCYHLVRFGLSVAEGLPSLQSIIEAVTDWDDDDDWDDDWGDDDTKTDAAPAASKNNANKSTSAKETLDAFTSIQADLRIADLKIVSGTANSITYKASSKRFIPKYEIKNNCLTIQQAQKGTVSLGVHKKQGCTITITVADSLDHVKIQADVGDITFSDQNITGLDLSADVGDIDLENCMFDKSTLEANIGDVDIKNCSFTTMDISNDVGDVDFDSKEDLSDYQIDLDTDLGDVSVNAKSYHHSYSHDGKTKHALTVSNDTGDIDLTY